MAGADSGDGMARGTGATAGAVLRGMAVVQAGFGLGSIALGSAVGLGAVTGVPRGVLGILGGILLMIGLVGPVRILAMGIKLPAEITYTIRVQALFLPLGGALLLLAAAVTQPMVIAGALLAWGIGATIAARTGFWQLSGSMPATFYFREMLAVIASAGLTGKASDSGADNAFRHWTGGSADGLPTGSEAPDGPLFTLGGAPTTLAEVLAIDAMPVVLNFGSYSCPHHRKRLHELEALMTRWRERGVRFLTIYTAEAHPEDGWALTDQYEADPEFTQTSDFCFLYAKTLEERIGMAKLLIENKSFTMDVFVDTMDDTLLRTYNTWPIRLYIVQNGIIRYTGNQGPFGYDVQSTDAALTTLMASV